MKRLQQLVILWFCVACVACVSSGDTHLTGAKNTKSSKKDKALIHAQLARGYLQKKQYAVAKQELEEALEIDPKHSDSNYVMGLLMLELKQYDEAEEHFRAALEADPSNASAAHDFGMFLCQIGKASESVKYFDLATDNPLFERADLSYMRAGECLAKLRDHRAEQYLKKALTINARLQPALYRLAVIKYQQKSMLSARAYIERYFAITKPQSASLYLAYQIESAMQSAEMAEKYKQALLEGFPGSEQASQLRKQLRKK